ncbi:hypothetical protein ACWGOE_08740 [Leucobacter chromiiresistens]
MAQAAGLRKGAPPARNPVYGGGMRALLLLLLVVWIVVAVIGFVIKGLFWLAVIGIVLFLVTGVIGMLKAKASNRP